MREPDSGHVFVPQEESGKLRVIENSWQSSLSQRNVMMAFR